MEDTPIEYYKPKHRADSTICQHGNIVVNTKDGKAECGCMYIDNMVHPCHGCHKSCGNCL